MNSAKDLLKHCDLSGTLNGIQLIHALSECTTISEKKISNILNSSCLRCSPRMLYYALVCGSSSTSTSTSTLSSSMSTPTSSTPDITNLLSKPGPKTSRITPCVNVLFQVAEKLLFKNIQDIVTNPMELFKETEVLPHLPAIDLVPIEKETDALSFLLILIEFFFYSLGYPYTQLTGVTPSAGSSHNSSSSGACAGGGDGDDIRTQPQNMTTDNNYHYMPTRQFMVSVTLIENSLRLLNYVLQTASNRSAKGVDLFGGDGKKFLSIFLTFLWMIDKSACLSEYSTLWSTSINEYMIKAVNNILHNSIQHSPTTLSTLELSTTILLNNLLIPVYPPVMGIWWPDPLSASTLSHFCATIASSASLTAFNSTLPQQQPQPNQSNSSMLYQFKSGNIHHLEGGFIQPCQLIGKCRLLRANLSQSTGSNNIISQLNICTLGKSFFFIVLLTLLFSWGVIHCLKCLNWSLVCL
ncbi:unnamed protein product [Trichobilharzia regenti]|nr:unnamed protein product [Trichobilharzia regenti]